MTTLAERCKEVGLKSAAELTRLTGTSKETLTNWLQNKPMLFDIVLKGATSFQNALLIEERYQKILDENENLLNSKSTQSEPEQTWCFSQEDLQEQAKLIERLTTENQELAAKIRLSEKNSDGKLLAKIEELDRENKVFNERLIMNDQALIRSNTQTIKCQCATKSGQQCQNNATHETKANEFYISVCEFHYNTKINS